MTLYQCWYSRMSHAWPIVAAICWTRSALC